MTPALTFLVQALLIVVLPPAILRCLRFRGLVPLVVMQIAMGIALGPSLLGRWFPELHYRLFDGGSLAPIQGIAEIAVLLFGFLTGLHFQTAVLRGRGRAFAVIATASLVVPIVLGTLSGAWVAVRYPTEVGPQANLAQFATAVGICIAVTALPVLAAILRETGLLDHRIGQLALGIAAVNDAGLWIALGLLLTAVAGPSELALDPFLRLTLLPVYLIVMTLLVRPLLARISRVLTDSHYLSEGGLVVACAMCVGSALTTEALGLHYILGAFTAGAVMPDDVRKPILDRLQVVTIAILMPFFFMSTGLRTLIDLGSPSFLALFAATTVVAIVGKMGGTALAARTVGESWPNALGLGALVQTKGLMEVIVLTILLDRQVISTSMFSALMMMALVSTLIATPTTRWILARERDSRRRT